jgi:N utilization substance protein A
MKQEWAEQPTLSFLNAMKSEFALALNQIGAERSLPREIISRVIETALVTSYRKNANIMNSQNVAATVDMDSGDMRVYVEKEVVDEVMDDRTEVILAEALSQKPDAVIGDCIMVDVTPKDFGRIAAQNAKQLIVQKLREAERDYQFSQFSEREGEIVMGLVQSVTPAGLTINLGRIEGVLPRKELLPNERYEAGKQVRAFVTEVRRGGRGPQINLSRTHKNMLRRLLEIEVPEIFDGKVEIKSITREPGSRSKVAVAAMQTGVDPVGACVGPRGTRIQGIINELNGEKIDVIEWSADPTVFITKALGPAKVLAVHPSAVAAAAPAALVEAAPSERGERVDRGKNAIVIVPDDQLSLAIGREGQNARLAARLTGWRIDIKSSTEALNEAVNKLNENPAIQAGMSVDLVQSLASLRELMMRQRAQTTGTPLSPDEFLLVKRVVDAVYAHEVAQKGEAPAAVAPVAKVQLVISEAKKQAQQAALAAIPKASYSVALDALGVSPRVLEHIQKAGILSVGQLLELSTRGDEGFLGIEGIGPKALTEIKQSLERVVSTLATDNGAVAEVVAEAPSAEAAAATDSEGVAEAPTAAAPAIEGEASGPVDEAQEFLNAIGEGEESEEGDDDATGDKKKDKDKGKKSAKGVLVFDEELGRMVLQRPRKRHADVDEFDE